jgi:hypothetical protein
VRVDPVGALLPGSTGMLTFNVTNTSKRTSGALSANVGLPPGVSFVGGGSLGMAAPMATSAPGGWSCGASTPGAQCTHGPLGPGQMTTTYLEVAISPTATPGPPPTITVSSGGRSVNATGGTGVVLSGLPARFAANGRLDTIVAGNTLPPCWWWGFGWHPPSSSAQVALPGSVLWAGLYWTGDGYPTQPAIDLRGPGGSFQTIGADSVGSTNLYGFPMYQAYANVTSQVAADGGGAWQAQVPANETDAVEDTGWTLVVVAQDPAAPAGQAVVVDGAHAVTAADPSFSVPLDGLLPAGASAGIQVVTWDGLGYYGDPELSSYRETLGTEPAVNLSATYRPYLVGVVAATTSADSTQNGPPPYDGWPGNRYSGWRVGTGGVPGFWAEGCSWIGFRPHAGPPGVKSVSGTADHASGPGGTDGHHGGSGATDPGRTGGSRPGGTGGGQPGGSKPGGSGHGGSGPGGGRPGGSKPGGSKPGGSGPGGSKPGGSKPGGSKTGGRGRPKSGSGSVVSQTSQDGPLPQGVEPNPCPFCKLL